MFECDCFTCSSYFIVPVEDPGHHLEAGPEDDDGDHEPGPRHGAPLLGHGGVADVDVALDCQSYKQDTVIRIQMIIVRGPWGW